MFKELRVDEFCFPSVTKPSLTAIYEQLVFEHALKSLNVLVQSFSTSTIQHNRKSCVKYFFQSMSRQKAIKFYEHAPFS